MRRAGRGVLIAVLVVFLAACSVQRPIPSRTATSLVSAPVAALPSLTPTPAPSPSATVAPLPTPTPTSAPVPQAVPTGVGGASASDPWANAIHLADGSTLGVVTVPILNVRAAPRLSSPVLSEVFGNHPLPVYEQVTGDRVDGNPSWYRVAPAGYVAAALVAPLIPPTPPRTFSGHWVDVDLTRFYAIAYNGKTPVYAAIITAGGSDNPTPTGVFQVLERVRNATMDAATVGIPKGSPGYYYLTNVQYTQYFKSGGYALHQNYWTPPDRFGNYSTHGCVGLLLPDAEWFWNFLAVGSTVSIHN
ncbi:MAG TPA: L,D-transpeptidase family protein [Thermomicrobiaceae bacterium]|nr:L,D-transpeptidase family protein [Thermomicrobiaceae bacterium]